MSTSYGPCQRCDGGELVLKKQGKIARETWLKCSKCDREYLALKCEFCSDAPYLQVLKNQSNIFEMRLRCPSQNCKNNITPIVTTIGNLGRFAPFVIASGAVFGVAHAIWLDHHHHS